MSPLPDHIVDHIIEGAQAGNVKMTTRGRSVTIRFGINPSRVVRNYTDADEWLVVRRILRDGGFQWFRGKTRSRKLLEKRIRSMMPGSLGLYIEVLPWREDGNYPAPSGSNEESSA